MLKLVIPENGTEDDAMIEHDFSGLREYPAFVSAAKKFEDYLENYAVVLHMPQNVLTDICNLAADATTAAMQFAYEDGLTDGIEFAKAPQQDDERFNSDEHTVRFPS